MPLPINLAQGFFNLSSPDPLSTIGRVATGTFDPVATLGLGSGLTDSLSLNNPTLLGEAWSQLSPYIPLPSFTIDPRALAVLARIPLPSNFVSRVPSTYGIIYPMPAIPQPWVPQVDPLGVEQPNNAPLSKFIALVRSNDFAFRSKYKVLLPTTVGISAPNSLDPGTLTVEQISAMCENAEMPGLNFGTQTFRVYGPTFERPSSISYGGESITLQFLVDQTFNVRKYFESWMALIAQRNGHFFNYPDNYLSSGIIISQLKHRGQELLSSEDSKVYSIRLIDAFPKAILPMQVEGSSRDLHRIAVVLSYRQWVSVSGESDPDYYYDSDWVNTAGSQAPTTPTDLGDTDYI